MASITKEFAAEPTSSTTPSCKYDVFLSFRGQDTRNNIVSHLHSNLVQKGFRTFIDDDGLRRGEEISSELHKAIQDSNVALVVFSENYASSKWCLEELVQILQCKKSNQQMVYPIFYKVDPKDVRHQRGTFGEALARHECRFKDNLDKVKRWREALTEAANLSGLHFLEGGHESKFIDAIIGEVSAQLLNHTSLNVARYPVGIESRVEDVVKLLEIGKNEVKMVGIWGVGGIGKTTIAKAVYNSIAYQFEASCFLANVREESMRFGGPVHLQNILLSQILGLPHSYLTTSSVDRGIEIIKHRIRTKRVLVILDDVNHVNQLNYLVGNSNWFSPSSRIIVTTRDKHCLTSYDVKEIYEMKKLSHHEALELFQFNAFQEHRHMDDYVDLVNSVLLYAKGLPLALEVLGSNLRGRTFDQWKCALDDYRSLPKQEIQAILKISYDALEPLIKEVFLHIACFFKGKSKKYVMDVLEGCDFPKLGIEILIEKALINITEANDIWMHDLLEEMGKEIVFQESPNEPGRRSRLWCYKDVSHVFEENTGTDKVQGIMVNDWNQREKICLSSESFLKLQNLQVFSISGDIFTGDHVNYLSNDLRLLDWLHCPLLSFPSSFNPKKLVVLNMPCSQTSPLGEVSKILFQRKMPWSCTSPLGKKTMENLKSVDLSNCYGITKLADFSRFPNLVDLNLSGCKNLVEVDHSIGFLKNLVNLNLRLCQKLSKFEIMEEMKSLKCLDLGWTAIKELSSSIRYLINLEKLTLRGCPQLTDVPCSIFKLQHLQHLDLFWCESLVTFPTKSDSSTSWTSLQEKNYDPLFVCLDSCSNLVEISEIPREIDSLDVRCCYKLKRISKLSNILDGKELNMSRRMNLFDCHLLCDNLASDYLTQMKKNNLPDDSDKTALLSLFLSCRQSNFEVLYPAGAMSEVPGWFSCSYINNGSMNGEVASYNFRIDFPASFKWRNKGLAFYALFHGLFSRIKGPKFGLCAINVNINGVCIIERSLNPEDRRWSLSHGHVWLYFMPLETIVRRLTDRGLPPPSMCLVTFKFEFESGSHVFWRAKRCGVHVVMPEEEDEGVMIRQVDNADCNFEADEDQQQETSNHLKRKLDCI